MSAHRARRLIDASERTPRPIPCGHLGVTLALGAVALVVCLPLAVYVYLTTDEAPR